MSQAERMENKLKIIGKCFFASAAAEFLGRYDERGQYHLDSGDSYSQDLLNHLTKFYYLVAVGSMRELPEGMEISFDLNHHSFTSQATEAYGDFLEAFKDGVYAEKFPETDAEFFKKIDSYVSCLSRLKAKRPLLALDCHVLKELEFFWKKLNLFFRLQLVSL